MNPKETRGKRLFLALAALLILEKLAGVAIALSGDWARISWLKSVAQPVGIALAVACLWQGDRWLQWLVGVGYVFSGGVMVFVSGRVLFNIASITPPDATGFFMQMAGVPIGLLGVLGLFDVAAGLFILFSPSLRAFFRYQRMGPQVQIESD